ncbi:hypothetical protein QBC47DRAFT_375692 [Echria macrotheca]|uniref:Transmembrane protein n=1 Tax=Echria macrotheca TaxID=438768 RepID=A0AAJ0BG80_9PEZI|nr:hypothetical protein QBC47DRAFT_375692 [Echria macrotheca]
MILRHSWPSSFLGFYGLAFSSVLLSFSYWEISLNVFRHRLLSLPACLSLPCRRFAAPCSLSSLPFLVSSPLLLFPLFSLGCIFCYVRWLARTRPCHVYMSFI